MKKFSRFYVLALLLVFSIHTHVFAQTDTIKVISPILLNKETLSGVGLQKVQLKNEPEREFFQKRLFRGEDISIYVVSSETWKTSMENFPFDEFVYILNGRANVQPKDGNQQIFNSYEFFTIPKGFTGTWEVLAGNNYHYELSVIATKRATVENTNTIKTPILLDKSKVSGVDINLNEAGLFKEVLSEGAELTVVLKAEKPRKVDNMIRKKDQLIGVLSGQVLIKNFTGEEKTFYTGDFFILPKGFEGVWETSGHGLFRSIVVERSVP